VGLTYRAVERLKPDLTEQNKSKQNSPISKNTGLTYSIGEPKYRKIMKNADKESNEMKEQYVGKDCVRK
jgi:hypothetical protein